jgi:hypothetical protein
MSDDDKNNRANMAKRIYQALHRGAAHTETDLESALKRIESAPDIPQKRLFTVALTERHQPTGRTRHYLGGELMPPPAGLAIVQFAGDSGFYLYYLDSNGKVFTDTYHSTIEQAKHQADFEFNVKDSDWEKH